MWCYNSTGASNSAFLTFHRGGVYAVYFGLDTDSGLKCGGWSDGTNYRFVADTSGNFTVRGTVNAQSDISSKKNIVQITDHFKILDGIRGVRFNWIENDKPSAGLIAQEVQEVIPELIHKEGEKLSLNYNGMIGVLVEAVKELKAEIEKLKAAK